MYLLGIQDENYNFTQSWFVDGIRIVISSYLNGNGKGWHSVINANAKGDVVEFYG